MEMDCLKSAVSFLLGHYPKAPNQKSSSGVELAHLIGEVVVLFGVYVTAKVVWTKKGEEMCFVTFSDEVGLIETVLFPQVYYTFRDLLHTGKAFIIKGKVENTLGAIQIQVYDASLIEVSLYGK